MSIDSASAPHLPRIDASLSIVEKKPSYAYLPAKMVSGATLPDPNLTQLNGEMAPFNKFKNLGNPDMLVVKKTPDGMLFISENSFVVDFSGREIPRALLITKEGAQLMKEIPNIIKMIDKGELVERKPKTTTSGAKGAGYGHSGTTTIVELSNGNSIAIKRFNRYKSENRNDGVRMNIGGLEVAKFAFALKKTELANKIRQPNIFFASQDILVMENIEDLSPIENISKTHPELDNTIRAMKRWLYIIANRVWQDLGLIGSIDSTYTENLYIDRSPLEIAKLKLVWIDPII